MYLKNSSIFVSILFVFLFVAQQIISFCFEEASLFSPYWILIFISYLIFGFKLHLFHKKHYRELTYLLIFMLGALGSYFNGHSAASCIMKSFYVLVAYIGYCFMSTRKIKLKVFNYLFIILYIFFIFKYYLLLPTYGHSGEFEGKLFGHSSSNVIPIVLNTVLIFYYILNKYYNENRYKNILMFSILNIILIIIQQSRAGILVSVSIILIIIYDLYWNRVNKIDRFIAIILTCGLTYLVLAQNSIINDYLSEIGLDRGIYAYEEDARSVSQTLFFANMDIKSFFLGYPPNVVFGDLGRTFNSFLDIWSRYGFIPFFYLVFQLILRIINRKRFELPFLIFIPILIYSTVETIYAGSLWIIVWFMILFLSNKKI